MKNSKKNVHSQDRARKVELNINNY